MNEVDKRQAVERALVKVVIGGEIAAATPAFNEMIDRLERAVIRRVFQRLNSGETLDPQFAVQAWMELFAHHRVRSSLTQTERVGQSAGETIGEHMDNGE